MLIARAEEKGALNVHSPIPGLVTEIRRAHDADGEITETVSITLEGTFSTLGRKVEYFSWKTLTKHEILHIINEKGVIDSESEATSLYQSLMNFTVERGDSDRTAIAISAMQYDGFDRTDAAILSLHPEEIAEGLEIIKKVSGTAKIRVLVSCREEIASIKKLLASVPEIEPVLTDRKYPQNHRGKLKASLESTFPERHLLLSSQALLSTFEAVARNKPMVERYVSIVGGAVKYPCVLKARIGTAIGDLFEECGGFSSAPEFIVMNDPFTGKALFDLDTPIEKGSRSLIALLPEEVHSGVAKPCIRCGHCSQVCPESLEPFLLYKAITSEISIASDELEARGLSACIGCAACAYVCPSRIPLAHAITVSQRRAARERRMNEA